MKMHFRATALLLSLAPALSGCWHVPLPAIWRLRNVDTLNVDPSGIRLAARAPDWLEAQPGGVLVTFDSQIGDESLQKLELALVETDDLTDLRALAGERRDGAHLAVFRASPADVARLRAFQVRVRAFKAEHPDLKGHGHVSIGAKACRRLDPPDAPVMIDLYLSLGEQEAFFKVYQDVDFRELIPLEKSFDMETPLCGKTVRKAG